MTPESQGPRVAPLVGLRGIVKRYGGVLAADHVDLDLWAGEVVGLVGKNGAGKSTIIKILAAAVRPDAGHVLIGGKPAALHDPSAASRLGLAFVHQELTLVPAMSVAENITIGPGSTPRWGPFVRRGAARRSAVAALSRLGVDLDPRTRVEQLNVARQRMVMIARGVLKQARLLVLDEPSASLSDEEISHLHEVVRSLCADGLAVLYVSHRVEEILALTDRIVVMRDGRVVDDRSVGEFDRATLVRSISGSGNAADPVPGDLAGGPSGSDPRTGRPPAGPGAVGRLGESLLRAEHLSAPGAVTDVTFEVRAGEILGIAGLVGSGRTGLVRLLYGAEQPSSGKVFAGGRRVRMSSPRVALREGIVLLPEDRRAAGNILGHSITGNITLPNLRSHRRLAWLPSPSAPRERRSAIRMIDLLQIAASDASQPVATLSGGNQQKVVLAKWLLHGASVFIFDEPTAGIDVGAKAEIYTLVVQLALAGKGIIVISSEFAELVEVCHRVVILREGRLVGELAGDAISEHAILEHCYNAT
jgi:ABC-type sugar transport system ATPase subunit